MQISNQSQVQLKEFKHLDVVKATTSSITMGKKGYLTWITLNMP